MSEPMSESARQRAVDMYRLVDTLPETAYEDVVKLASVICEVPIALVSLIDRDRQWFKAKIGVDFSGSGRDVAFCNHAIRNPDQLMEVADTREDPRFAANPMVTGENNFRFYAGMPLVTPEGAPIGTVCVLDREPRSLSESQRSAMEVLARLTMALMDGRHRELVHQREAMLGGALVENAAAPAIPFTVAIFELQDYATVAARMGERPLERSLRQLDHVLEAQLHAERRESVNRSSGSAEAIVLLHPADAASAVAALEEAVRTFENASGLHFLSAWSTSTHPQEPIDVVFLRADEALTEIKNARALN